MLTEFTEHVKTLVGAQVPQHSYYILVGQLPMAVDLVVEQPLLDLGIDSPHFDDLDGYDLTGLSVGACMTTFVPL